MWKRAFPLCAVASLTLFDCGEVPPGSDPTCGPSVYNPDTGTFTAFGGSSANARKVNAFLRATLDVNTNINQIHDAMLGACEAIGTDLGITSYTPTNPNEPRVVTVCNRVGMEIQTIVRQAVPQNARLEIIATPPRCEVSLDVAARCAAECTGRAMVEVPRCQPGDLVVSCNAACEGVCQGTCMAGCMGSCSGTCTGSCNGTCVGECTGTCSARDGAGRCVGTCTGTCRGSCSASCMGSCEGTCAAGCNGSCMGSCRGGCTATGSPIRCEGRADLNVDVQCDAACEARANLQATCSEPMITVNAQVGAPAMAMRLNTLVTSLQRHYPRFLVALARAQQLGTSTGPAFISSLNGAAEAAVDVGVQAVACSARAVAVTAAAFTRFQATVDVSVSFTASVNVQGTAQ